MAAIAAAALIGAGLAVTPATPALAAPAQGVYPRDLPALSSAEPADAILADPEAAGDFAPLADGTAVESSYDPATSEVADRSEFTTTYDNTNGTQTITQSTEPMNVEDEDGNWQPIEVDLTDGDEGRAETDQHPLSPSFAEDAGDPDLLQVAVDDHTASLGLVKPADDSEVDVDGSTAEYADIAPNTDLAYQVTPSSVKETIVLDEMPPEGINSWQFTLNTDGLTPRLAAGGIVELVDDAGNVPITMPAIQTWDSAGNDTSPPATTGGTYALTQTGDTWVLTVTVDKAWLRSADRVYPVNVDPTFTYNTTNPGTRWWRSNGATCTGSANTSCGVKIGNSRAAGADSYNRTAINWDFSNLWGKTVVSAQVDVTRVPNGYFQSTQPATLNWASSFSYNGVGQQLATAVVGDVGTFRGDALNAFIRDRVNARDNSAWLMMVGNEVPGATTYKNLTATMSIDVGSPAPAPTMVTPADNSVISTLTPTLSVNPVTDPDGETVTYCFRIATGPDGKTGTVVDSGCLASPSWTVPAAILNDGVAYTWIASAYSGSTMTTGTTVGHFKVDQRIGNHGPSPVDTMGPVQVNLANGNVTTTAPGPTFTTVGGSVGLNLTYNSQQSTPTGLTASYYDDPSHAGLIDDNTQKPVLVRNEPQVNNDWGTASPFPPILGTDWFLTRWQGYFVPPVTGTYQFAGLHDDTGEVWINNNVAYNNTAVTSSLDWTKSTGVQLTAGQMVPITVESEEMTGGASMKLYVRTTAGGTVPEQLVPSSWLTTTDSPALPQGWTLSADLDGSGAVYTDALIADQTVVLTDASGAKHTWTRTNGSYTPPADEAGIMAIDAGGRVTVTEGGQIYTFRTDGKLDTLTSTADSRKPAALQNVYSGTPSRLTQIVDPVSGRSATLTYNRSGENCYNGANVPSGFDNLPPGRMLCRITYWNGTETRYWYSSGRLARVENPGGIITDYAYDTNGLLTGVRDPLGADWVASNPATNAAADATTTITYTTTRGKPAAQTVTGPKPTPTQDRPQRTYRYDSGNRTTFIDAAGLNPAIGFFSKVIFDDADRLLSTTDATGVVTAQSWNVQDQQLSSTDAAGRVSTTVYDARNRPVAAYGPAPASCFSGQTPTSACSATVPQTTTGYDEGLAGLGVAFYDNTTLTGAPKVFQTGLGTSDGRLRGDWASGAAPTTGVPANTFGLRATGDIVFPAAGTYSLELEVDDGARLWIDDTLVVDTWTAGAYRAVSGTFVNPIAGSSHRIRIDYYNNGGSGALHLNWKRPDGTYEQVPGQNLKPSYNLVTSTTNAESAGVPDRTSTTSYSGNGLDATYGLPTATTTGGLTTSTGYEAIGTGYLRRTTKTMPTGAQVTYTAYGDTEQRTNPCDNSSANQAGLPKLITSTAPANGVARTDEQIYDATGRVVARATSGAWQCTTYDSRNRPASQTYPAGSSGGTRTVQYNYAVNGDPLVSSVTDNNGTIRTQVDLLGRVVRYTDAVGVVTDITYDRAGRIVTQKVAPPNSADAAQQTTYTYDDAGRGLTVVLDGATLATVTYTSAGELASIAYGNGSSLQSIARDTAGAVTSLTWRTSDNRDVVSSVTRTRAGTVTDESLGGTDARPAGANFGYDSAGRLIDAWVTGHHYSYDFTSTADASCPSGTQANAGLNTNRVRLTDETATGTAVTRYCYNAADQLTATLGANATTGITYDSSGNTTSYTQNGATTGLTWDGSGRNIGLQINGTSPANVTYMRDASDRIIRRTTTAGDSMNEVRYGYTTSSDTAALTLSGDQRVQTRTISLPGGVLYTWTPSATARTYDHPSVRGDLSLTTDSTGKQSGNLRTYGPFGESLSTINGGMPDNQPGNMDYGWLGQNQRSIEHAGALLIVQMGARPYSPQLGRFLSVDPMDGGSANNYDYSYSDPINNLDLAGTFPWRRAFNIAVGVVGIAGAVTCVVATAGVCGAVALGVAGVSIANDTYGVTHGEQTGRQYAANTVWNVATAFIPGARSVRLGGAHSVSRFLAGMRNSPLRSGTVRLTQAFRLQPVRTVGRIALNGYIGYHGYTGRWGIN